MKKKSVPIIFFGNERLATGVSTKVYTLKALIEAGFDIKAVISNYNRLPSRSPRDLEVETIAKNNSIPVLLPKKLSSIKNKLSSFEAQIAILVAYGQIIPESIINIFPHGIINIHPSLLPLYRGSTPVEQVILNGATKTGVSLMSLTKGMDEGPIFAQSEISLNQHESKQYLANKLLELGSKLLIEKLPLVLNHNIKPVLQDNHKATYCGQLTKQSGRIDWRKTANQLEREIRAFSGWPKSQTLIANLNIVITKAEIVDENGQPGTIIQKDKRLIVYCGQQALEIIELKPAGKVAMSAKAFLAGYKERLNLSP